MTANGPGGVQVETFRVAVYDGFAKRGDPGETIEIAERTGLTEAAVPAGLEPLDIVRGHGRICRLAQGRGLPDGARVL